jgi:Ca-activated chloride channel family protein
VKNQSLQKGPSAETIISTKQGKSPRISFERSSNPVDIKSFLGYDLRTYEDPVDHGKYFRLIIRVGEVPGTLAAIPKEIIFLLDASNSIGSETLKEFKKGIEACFNLLGPQDKFNVVVFKNTILKMSEESLPNSPENLKKARNFLAKIRAGLDTDIYSAVLQGIELKNSIKPAYVLLLSDGQPTTGIKHPQQVINQITQNNKGRLPVFAFGSGVFLDKYLMNFLAFTNRGWAEFSVNNAQKGTVTMYTHIKDPVLLNLRYYISGLNEKEIYPKLLPDLFKGSQFVLYGRYTDEKSFYFQLFGDSYQDIKQYLITDDIASAPKGDKKIAQEWAIRKIYHLIGLFEYNKDNQSLVNEVEALAKKFSLKIPSYEIKK